MQITDSDGNRVYVGNFDSDGWNVNNYSPGDSNDNLRVVVFRQFSRSSKYSPERRVFVFSFSVCRFFLRSYPSSEHAADFVDVCLKRYVFAVVDRFYFQGKAEKNAKRVKVVAGFLYDRQFFRFGHLAGQKHFFENVYEDAFAFLPDGETILLGNGVSHAVHFLVDFVEFFEQWYVELVHKIDKMKIYKDIFEKMISPENLFRAWESFKSDKKKKRDVQMFELKLEENIFRLYRELRGRSDRHGGYSSFFVQDPKQRHLHKPTGRDRVLHHAAFSVLNPLFEETFIPASFSCRIEKGTHKGVDALGKMIREESKNYSRPCFILKCDIKKFFDTVDHGILLDTMNRRVKDPDVQWLLQEIVGSYSSGLSGSFRKRGVPIGNLTSQLFANVYMNELDQFAKHELGIKHYARYTDDFVIVGESREVLSDIIKPIDKFLREELALELHPKKVSIRKCRQGADFLGYIEFPYYRKIRTKTKKRIFKKMKERVREYEAGMRSEESLNQCLQSYLGVLSHADAYKIREELLNQFWFWRN